MELQGSGRLAELFRVFRQMSHTCVEREMERQGLTELTNPHILFLLRSKAEGQPVLQKQVAQWLGVAPPTVAVSVKRMEKAGLVRKTVNKDDLRENYLELTEKGSGLTRRCEQVVQSVYDKIFSGFGEEDLQHLCAYLERMIRNMEGLGMRNPGSLQAGGRPAPSAQPTMNKERCP